MNDYVFIPEGLNPLTNDNGTVTISATTTGNGTPLSFAQSPRFALSKDKVALEPFQVTSIEAENTKGFAYVKQKVKLTPLKIVIGNENLAFAKDLPIYAPTGATAYVKGDMYSTHPYAKEVFEIEGLTFILVPIDQVQLVVI